LPNNPNFLSNTPNFEIYLNSHKLMKDMILYNKNYLKNLKGKL